MIVILILMSCLTFGLTRIFKSVFFSHTQNNLVFYELKSHYLALSGSPLYQKYWDQIPLYPIPFIKTKEWLYTNLDSALLLPENLDGQLYLIKSDTSVFTIGIVDQKYRSIIKQDYQLLDGQVVFGKKERL